MLNFNATGENWEPGERQTLERLKLAIKYKQKQVNRCLRLSKVSTPISVPYQFVAHPNVQQLLAKIWYDGLPGFRRKGCVV